MFLASYTDQDEALAAGIVCCDSDANQPVVICTGDTNFGLGATALPAAKVGDVLVVGSNGDLEYHADANDGTGKFIKVIGIVKAAGFLSFNLSGLTPAVESYTTP